MAVKIDVGDDNPAADPCCMAGKVVCGIPASLFGMDFLSAGQCAINRISAFYGKTRDKQDFWKRLIWNPVKIWRSTEKD